MAKPLSYLERARRATREEFVEACPFYFLIGKPELERPDAPRATVMMGFDEPQEGTSATRAELSTGTRSSIELLLLAVRKVQDTFPSMITVGRTQNNDIVVPDVNISRFHAYFRVHPDRVELA